MERDTLESIDSRVRAMLRDLRVSRGVRQSALAQALGQPQSFVSKYEMGERRLSLAEVRQICECLEMSLPEFVEMLERKISAAE